MSNILTRTVFGAIFVVVVLGAFLLGEITAAIVLGTFMLIGVNEFYNFFKNDEDLQPIRLIGITGAIILFSLLIILQISKLEFDFIAFLVPLFFIPFVYIILSHSKNPLLNLGLTFFPWIYILFPFYLMFRIYTFEVEGVAQWLYIVGFFILVWSNDIFAYLSGRFFGKNKLFERISPKKTWEGAIGGFLMTIVFGVIYSSITDQNYLFWILAGIIVSPLSVIGDLIESRFKRLVNVKDSGNILPGHGGVLDRFDASMFAAPFFYFLLVIYFL